MTGSLFSLPGTQYINVEHIDLIDERDSYLKIAGQKSSRASPLHFSCLSLFFWEISGSK